MTYPLRPAAGLLIVLISLAMVGCGSFVSSSLDFAALLTCPTDRLQSDADLRWSNFTVTQPADARPGTLITLRMDIFAVASADTHIGMPSNVRIFLSFDQTLDSNDYLVGEYVVDNLLARQVGQPVSPKILIEEFRVPRPTEPPTVPGFEDQYFPVAIIDPAASNDPNYDPFDSSRPEYIGPQSINYWVIAVADSSNCIDEYSPDAAQREPGTREDQRGPAPTAGSQTDPAINNQFVFGTQLNVQNPNLPNLTIRFREVQPVNTAQAGGIVITDWEVTNSGVGPVLGTDNYTIRVMWSEDDDLDSWDVELASQQFSGPLNPGSQVVQRVTTQIPYTATRQNSASTNGYFSVADTASAVTVPPGGLPNAWLDRNPDVEPSAAMQVYAPIPSSDFGGSFLIAIVDSTNAVVEQVEVDNTSADSEANGTLSVRASPPGNGGMDVEAISIQAAVINGVLEVNFRMNIAAPGPVWLSLGFYLSEDPAPSSADYFWNRFVWASGAPGDQTAQLFFPAPLSDEPAPLEWYFVGVADDVLAIPESDETNNVAITAGGVRLR